MEFDFSFSAMYDDLQFVQTGYWGQQQNIEDCLPIEQSVTVPEFSGFAYSLPISVADKQVTMDDLSDFIDSDWSSVSPQSTPSPRDFVAWAFDQTISDEGSQWALSQDSTQSDCSFNQFAECSTASNSAAISVSRPLTYTLTVLEPNFLVNKESANFNVVIEPGRRVKAAPWTVSSFFIFEIHVDSF
jgi:hypothetical protein